MTTPTTEEIVDIAKQSGLGFLLEAGFMCHQEVKDFAKLVAERERKFYMQLFLDPENQPTQFGTAIEQYREQEVNDETEMCAEVVLDEIKKYDELNFQHLRYVLNRIYFKIRARGITQV